LGYNDIVVEGTWVWSSGETTSFENWKGGEPNNQGNEDVAEFQYSNWGGLWNDLPTVVLARPVLEVPAKPPLGWSWPRSSPSVSSPYWGCLADMDGDQDLDYVVPNRGASSMGDTLGVFINDGSGSLLLGPVIQLGESGPLEVKAIDHDQDGDSDLVVTTLLSQKLLLVQNDGALGYSMQQPILSGIGCQNVRAVHADGDGILDLVASSPPASGVYVFLGQLGGGFGVPKYFAVGDARFLAVGDLNGDGTEDIVVSRSVDHEVTVLVNDGAGVFAKTDILPVPDPKGLSLGDLDGDGDLDLCINSQSGVVEIWGNDGTAQFAQLGPAIPCGANPVTNTVGDFDSDGDLDIAVASQANLGLFVLLNDGFGGFPKYELLSNHTGPFDVLTADLDGDGSLDIVGSDYGSSQFTVHLNHVFPDCNGNGIPDIQDIAGGASFDCNGNGVPDECDLASSSYDCDLNGLIDTCEISADPSLDCDGNGILDLCDLFMDPGLDCDGNLLMDSCEILADPALDCDGNGVLDSCDIVNDPARDCDLDGILDACQIISDPNLDCDGDGALDSCQIAGDPSLDCDSDGTLDSCQIFGDPTLDCDGDGSLDSCQIAGDPGLDQDGDGILDSCQCDFSSFCISTANSTGLPGTIGWMGSASISANDLTLTASNLPPFQFGIYFYGADEWFNIMGDGVLCIAPPLYRIKTVVTTDVSGTTSLAVDYNTQPFASGAGQVAAFSTWRFQLWYRDPTGGPAGSNTTDGLLVTFCP